MGTMRVDREKLLPASGLARNLRGVLDSLVSGKESQFAIVRHGQVTGVLLSVREYEEMTSRLESLEKAIGNNQLKLSLKESA